MSEIIDLLQSVRLGVADFSGKLLSKEDSEDCAFLVKRVETGLLRAVELTQEHERRDRLFDELYYNVGSKLNATFDQNELLDNIIDALGQLISFDAAGIFLVDTDTGNIEAEVIKGYRKEFLGSVHQKVGEGVLGWVIESAQSVRLADVRNDDRYIDARPETRSEVAAPMVSEGKVIGCINLESDKIAAFSEEDVALLETFATQASLAVQRARLYRELVDTKRLEEEVALARKIQTSLLPKKPPQFPGYDLAGMNIPSTEVGGDYYDFIRLIGGGLGLAIADVSGKGIGAAFIMSGVRASLRAEIRHNLDPSMLMHKVNHFVYESTDSGSFVTAFYGVLNGDEFNYVNAGHNPPILMRGDQSFIMLEDGGLVLGLAEEQHFREGRIHLEPGDTLLLYTDGVSEAMNRQEMEFGAERLIEALKESQGMSANVKVDFIHRNVRDFAGRSKQADDLTIMVVNKI